MAKKKISRDINILYILFFTLFCILLSQSAIGQNQNISNSVSKQNTLANINTANLDKQLIKPGDKLNIIVEGYEDYNRTVTVDKNGIIQYLPFGRLKVKDLTIERLKKEIEYVLAPYISSPNIQIELVEEESIIKLGDTVNIIVSGKEEYNRSLVVDEIGNIDYLDFGELQTAGLTSLQLKEVIEKKLSSVMFDPEVKVSTLPEDYVVKTGDMLDIIVKNHEDLNYRSAVQKSGQILHPTLGYIKANYMTIQMIQEKIRSKLVSNIPNAEVKVSVLPSKPEFEKESLEEYEKFGEFADKKKEVEYIIAPGDILSIVVKNYNYLNIMAFVESDGKISDSQIGNIRLAGLTETQAAQNIKSELVKYTDDPQISVKVKGHASLTEVSQEELWNYEIKPGDIIDISIDGRSNYNQIMVVQENGTIPYRPIGKILIVGKNAEFISRYLIAKLPIKIDMEKIDVSIRKLENLSDKIEKTDPGNSLTPKLFGHDFFTASRDRIKKAEDSKTRMSAETLDGKETIDAISGFVGPMDMMDSNVNATIPEKYVLRAGDKITITYWSESDVINQEIESLVVNDKGEVTIDRIGKFVVRGMTLAQFQESVKDALSRIVYKDLKLYATLDKLKSIQIFITGEVFKPGSYAASSVTTLFNALYMCGGPSENGTLRDIKLIKANETKSIDFYKFLMKGDSSQDFNLDSGDTILIPQIGRIVTLTGEIKRPAIYELAESENLKQILQLAGGIRPTGFLQRVKIDSVDPSRKRIILDIDMSEPSNADAKIYDGDTVTVFSIPSERMNTVSIEGKVNMPGVYQLKDGMKVSDLIHSAQDLLGEAYMEQADLIRLNTDNITTMLIPIELSKALSGDPENDIALNQWDKLVVYSKLDIKWGADRVVNIHGAVRQPGSYDKADGMTVYDLIARAGGTLPNAYLEQASIMRFNERGESTVHISVNLDLAMKKDKAHNIELQDSDTLMIYTYQEAKWTPERIVYIKGAVQREGSYTRADGMMVSDLIQVAGGMLPEAFPNRALLLRLDERQKATQGFFLNLKLALENDPSNNLELRDGDELLVYTYKEARWEPERNVSIGGAIQSPGIFERTSEMRISDLINRSGGILPNAYLERADLRRFAPDWETYKTIPVNIGAVFSGDNSADILLEDGDLLQIYTINEAKYTPENAVTIYGAVQKPDTYIKSIGMKLSDLIFQSGGLLPGAQNVEVSRIGEDGSSVSISSEIMALDKDYLKKNIDLIDGDIVFVRKAKDFLELLNIVTLNGEVKYPGRYALKQDEKLSDLIQRAGGLTNLAYPDASTITRKVEYLVYDEQEKSVRQVGNLFADLAKQEYQREYASALLKSGLVKSPETKTDSGSDSVMGSLIQAVPGLGAIAQVPEQIQTTTSGLEEIRQEHTIVTPARKLPSLLPSGRLLIDVANAIDDPNTKDNVVLRDGDVIVIPGKSFTVSASGAVIQPSSLIYDKSYDLGDYIAMAGGYSRDADVKAVYVIKANGMVVKGNKAKFAPGDMIVVPTKVMVQKVTDRWGQIFGVIKFSIGVVATLYALKLILG